MTDSLRVISDEVAECRKCRLYKQAKHGVPGEGNFHAKVFFIGQAPGAEEDKTGKPFVGRAGQFLTKMLGEIGLKRQDIFITSTVKHFPPKNRMPKPDEIHACKPYLLRQIHLVNPKIVVLLGKVAENNMKNEPMLKNKKVLVTVHPSAAMRFPKMAVKMRKDFRQLKSLL